MTGVVNDKGAQGARKLVLGFDAGCFTCSNLAERIEERVGKQLAVQDLNDPELLAWRKEAFGEDAKWAPTLFEIEGETVRAWIGWKMGWALSHKIGPTATWQVMQALGEVGAAPRIEESSVAERLPEKAAEAVVGMSRGQFLKDVGGAAVAMSVLSGFEPFARPAAAREEWRMPRFTGYTQLRGRRLKNYCNAVARFRASRWTAGSYASAMRKTLNVRSNTDPIASNRYGVQVRAREYKMRNGNEVYVCSFNLKGRKILTYHGYERKHRNVKWEVKRWGLGPNGGRLWLERANFNGANFYDPNAPSYRTQASCPTTCNDPLGNVLKTTCSSYDVACLIEAGASCAASAQTCKEAKKKKRKGLIIACAAAALVCVVDSCCRQTCTVCIPCAAAYPSPG